MSDQRKTLQKLDKKILRNCIPRALVKKLGEEKTMKLCTRSNYRERRRQKKCPKCGCKKLLFRSTTRDFKCDKCKNIIPAKSRAIGGGMVIGGSNGIWDREMW